VFHFGEIRIPDARAELLRAGVPVRPHAGVAFDAAVAPLANGGAR
jgi:hypothetical protein